ncbi:hypothetical protein MMC12_001096 [Toensbergia leucococca]|nr:hypothetical protein [Toensbergia leucococca]
MSIVRLVLLAALLTYHAIADSFPRRTAAAYFPASNTSTAAPSIVTGALASNSCCFVFQDLVEERWFASEYSVLSTNNPSITREDYSTTYFYYEINVTSLITSVTQYIDTTVTNYNTVVTTSNSTASQIHDIATDQIGLVDNRAPGPSETATELQGTIVVTAGTTVTSPQAFYVYSTIKIVTAQAVTSSGQVVCGTESTYSTISPISIPAATSTFTYTFGTEIPDEPPTLTTTYTYSAYVHNATTITYSGINSYAEAYFGYLGFGGAYSTDPSLSFNTFTESPYTVNGYTQNQTIFTDTYTSYQSFGVTNPAGSIIASLPKPTGVTISFSEPFIYLPSYGATEGVNADEGGGDQPDQGENCELDGVGFLDKVDFGYVPQDLIEWVVKNPDYLQQYPGLESCLPGGPSILLPTACTEVSPASESAAQDLTTSTAVTVTSSGCFRPGHCRVDAASTSRQAPTTLPLTSSPTSEFSKALAESNTQTSPTSTPMTSIQPTSSQSASSPHTLPESPGPESTAISLIATNAQQLGSIIASAFGFTGTATAVTSETTVSSNPVTPTAGGQTVATSASPPSVSEAAAPQGSQTTVGSVTVAASGVTIGSSIITANSASQYIVGSQTLVPGGSALILSGTTVYLAPSASAIVIGGSTTALPTSSQSAYVVEGLTLIPTILAGSAVSAGSSNTAAYVIQGQTIVPGAPAVTISGVTVSLASSATAVVVGGSTAVLPAISEPAIKPAPVLTIGSQLVTANLASEYLVGSQTLVAGGSAITVSGTVVSLAPSATAIVVGGSTAIASPIVQTSASSEPVITIGGQLVTANSASNYVIGSQTLVPGAPAITLSGTLVSLAPSGSDVVIGGSTAVLSGTGSPVAFAGSGHFHRPSLSNTALAIGLGLLGILVL